MKFIKSLAATALVVAASCGGGGTDYGSVTNPTGTTGGTQTGGSTAPVMTNAISIGDDFFSPVNAQVPVGTTVTWTWGSGVATHNVTFADGASSGDKAGGATYSRTFTAAGTFTYRCTRPPSMTGSVIVQ